MRIANGTSSTTAGVTWQRQPFITVEFYWFSLPAALWLMAMFFFFATVIVSRRSDLPIWKSSPLVLLHAKDGRNKMASFVDVDRQAKSTSVELRHKGDGWCLRETTWTGLGQIHGDSESYRM
ncbi:hypothetical protein BDV96DRAFT_584389 [Lophiotrema nucula]|uniref:Uncharacterized protein n=1 Tax=Lophiotrema nucula TaxID=690887 RepID=A0A6A5YVK5_9PLEO|nr:hypothetical protein BDV96DRAFT_584389 [Lophiotrema nucula]